MKFATKCLFALVVLTVTTQLALADSLNVTGPTSASLGLGEGNGQQALAINVNTSTSQSGLSMDAVLSGFGGSQTVSWWLTDQIGAGTTGANVFASGTFAGPGTLAQNTNIFNGISLNAGSYFVVLSTIGQGNNSGWDFTGAPTVTSTGALSYSFSSFVSQGSGSFAPAFTGWGSTAGVNFEFDLQSSDTPEPASLVLLGSGLLGAGSFVRRKLIS